MKKLIQLLSVVAIFLSANVMAQDSIQNKYQKGNRYAYQEKSQTATKQAGFIDEDGDGYNDNAMDSDGDGIPNGMDPDYTGAQNKGAKAKGFIDADGDGINDNALDSDGDGIPNGQDPDYLGSKARRSGNAKGFVDADGDGINDNAYDDDGDGIPNGQDPDYEAPQDCSGNRRGQQIGGTDGGSSNGTVTRKGRGGRGN
ncbi:MAG: hypothetical protein R2751_01095 [Bacteroidales bacterium]